jgi:glycosyltransferase involved in cell wall biosynthesis
LTKLYKLLLDLPMHRKVQPIVSVNLCCYNSERFLRETLKSVATQTDKSWELVVINDGSMDATESIIKDFMREGYPVTYHYQSNKGLGASRNKALELSKGEYIAFLDHDDVWFPEKLEKQVSILGHRSDIDFVYTNFYNINMKNNRLSLALHGRQPEGFVFDQFLCHYPVGLLTVMARKIAIDNLDHPFDVNLKLLEELDLFMRLLYRSQAVYLPEPLAMYRIHSNMSSKILMTQYPDEWAYLLEKFRRIIPLFEQKYPDGVNRICARGAFCQAKVRMMENDAISARKLLDPYKWIDSDFFLFYLMTFFPIKIWDISKKIRSRLH